MSSPPFERIAHWSTFGQRGQHPNPRVPVLGADSKPFLKPESASWDASISPADLPRVLDGFRPQAMEDKWSIYADAPDAQGAAAVHMHRSWTGYKLIELRIAVALSDDGEVRDEDARVTGITWETDRSVFRGASEQKMKEMAAEVCAWVLDVELKTPS